MASAKPQNKRQFSEKMGQAVELIKSNELSQAQERLTEIASDSKASESERLSANSHLVRIAAELRQFEKIPALVEAIQKIPVQGPEAELCLGECFYQVATGWLYSGSSEKARQHFRLSLEIANKVSNPNLIFANQLAMVELLRQEGQYQQVLAQIDTLQKAAADSGNPYNVGNVWLLLGNIYRKQGNSTAAINAYEQAREIFSVDKNGGNYHYVLWAMGTCYAALEDKEKAKIYLELAISNMDKNAEFRRINVLSMLTLAELNTITGDYEKADFYYKKAIEIAGSDESSYFGRRIVRGQTLLAIRKGELDLANEYIDRLVIVAVREKNQGELMRLRLLKAEILLRAGEAAQHDEARAMLEEALVYFKEREVRRHQAVCYELLARLDSRSGNPHDAVKKADEMLKIAQESAFDRLRLKASLCKMTLERKLGKQVTVDQIHELEGLVNRLNAEAERVILARFTFASYEDWTRALAKLNPYHERYVNDFFEDFHFVPVQSIDMEIDQNSHYVREKHLGEIPFHNKFTLMRILCLIAETPGREFSKEQLAKEIWGQEYNPLRHDNNIYININRLRKLVEPNPRESRYVMNGARGYYFNPAMKVKLSSKISDTAPRAQPSVPRVAEGVRV